MLGMFLVLSTSMIMITCRLPETIQNRYRTSTLHYGLENGVSFTIGKYGSKLGFEREDPSGLYT